MGLLSKWREYRKEQKRRKQQAHMAGIFGNIQILMDKKLLFWEGAKRRLYIAEPLALVMLGKGRTAWCNFLQNLYLHRSFQLQLEANEKRIQEAQSKAVKDRVSTGVPVKTGEMDRIRRAVRDGFEHEVSPVEKIETFEFVVIEDHPQGDAHAKVTIVGEYNPETNMIDMAPWEDVQAAINAQQKEQKK